MDNSTDWVIIGRFGRAHGIKGLITVHSFTDPWDNILSYTDWHRYSDNRWQPLKILHLAVYDKTILAQIEGYCEREKVSHFTNAEIAVKLTKLHSLNPGEYYWHQLIGLQVINLQGQEFGKVSELLPTGANDVLVVQGKKKHLIPYLPGQFVMDVNLSQQIITVDWEMDF